MWARRSSGVMVRSLRIGTGPTQVGPVFRRFGSACGIRTRDLRLERAVSWASRRMRPVERGPHQADPVAQGIRLAGDGGFEPPHTDPESAVLPLDESPI